MDRFPSELRKKRFKQARRTFESYGTGGYGTVTAVSSTVGADAEVFSDAFTRANQNLVANANWTLLSGTAGDLAITSNAVKHSTTTSGGSFAACPDCGTVDQYVSSTWKSVSPSQGFLLLCWVNTTNYMLMDYNGTNIRGYCVVAGTTTQRINTAASVNGTTDILKARRFGSTFQALVNGVLKVSYTLTAGEIAALTGTRAGYRNGTTGSGATFADNFSHGFTFA